MPHTLYCTPQHAASCKSLIAAKYGGVDIEVAKDFQMGVTNKSPEYLKLNPFGKIPTMKTADGKGLFESNAIARFVARTGNAKDQLLGATPYEQAVIDEWIDVISYNIQSHVYPTFLFKYGYMPFNEEAFNNARNNIAQTLAIMEKQLTHEYFVANHVTLVDIILACTLAGPLRVSFDSEYRKAYPKLFAYLRKLYDLPQFKECLGPVEFVEKFEKP
jgi:elongation factor 1-gamma